MALRIDKVQLQFDIKPNYEAQQLNKLKDDLRIQQKLVNCLEKQNQKAEKEKCKFSETQKGCLASSLVAFETLTCRI
jgi:hypothetical protein